MSHEENYDQRLPELLAIDADSVVSPNMPVQEFGKEADWLYGWARKDQAALSANGLDWTLVEDIPIRASVLFQAQLNWREAWLAERPAAEAWENKSKEAQILEDKLIRSFRLAFSGDKNLANQLGNLSKRDTYAGLIYNLGELSSMGKKNPDLLAEINFDMTLLDAADTIMEELRVTWTAAVTERHAITQKRELRDRAYTYLKQPVDKVRKFGKFVFHDNESRLKGYASDYHRSRRHKQEEEPAPAQNQEPPQDQDPVVDPIVQEYQAA